MCKNKILIFNIYTVKIFNLTADKKILIKTTSFSFLPIKLVIIFKTYYTGWANARRNGHAHTVLVTTTNDLTL